MALARERDLLGPKPGDKGSRVPHAAPAPPAPLGPPPMGKGVTRNGAPRPAAALDRLF